MSKSITEEFLREEFVQKQKSTSQIAKELSTHPTTIRRLLQKFKIPLRDKSEAQTLALKNKTAIHPTEGKPRSQADKEKIYQGTYSYWQNLSEKEKAKWCKMKKKEWKALSREEKKEKCRLAAKAVRKTVKDGSKLERYLCGELRSMGYRVEFHKENFLLNTRLQTDLLLPEQRICVEIDGISHFDPIHGEEKLDKQKRADREKNGLLLANGFHVVRLKAIYKTLAKARMKEYLTSVLKAIEDLKSIKSPTIVHI